MKLRSLKYSEYQGDPREWQMLDCTFGDINLIVGKNASGKSRTLNVIFGLAQLFVEDQSLRFDNGSYDAEFDENGATTNYILRYANHKVIEEKLHYGGRLLLDRQASGEMKVLTKEVKGDLTFQTPQDRIAVVTRRDPIQHPFLQDLYNWGSNVRIFRFGTPLGQDKIKLVTENMSTAKLDTKDTEKVVDVFLAGIDAFGKQFTDLILRDMRRVGFPLEEIGISLPEGLQVAAGLPFKPFGVLFVKEADLPALTFQHAMSQGMFRALSVIIQLDYSLLANVASSVLIDDIGEGLDFDRSSALIDLMIEKASQSAVQLIMATNDRFVMNKVPLQHWIILERIKGKVIHHNYRNSKEVFDEFRLTGLSNFDLFSSRYHIEDSHQR
jgi:Fe-S cluster assembly ATPase SufC